MAFYSGLDVGIDIERAGIEDAANVYPGGALVDAFSPLPTGANHFVLDRMWHDEQCPGQYVLGVVVDSVGAPIAGVHVSLVDAWNNSYMAVSKGGGDAGRFDFPIYGTGSPQKLVLQVQDGTGNPLSPPIVVPHRLAEADESPCHHIVVRRVS